MFFNPKDTEFHTREFHTFRIGKKQTDYTASLPMQELWVLPSRLLAIDPVLTSMFVECLKESGDEELLELLQEFDQLRFPAAIHAPRQLFKLMSKCTQSREDVVPKLLTEATIENLRRSLESNNGYRCVAAVVAEKLWQYVLNVKFKKIDRCKGFDAVISAVLGCACPSVEDIIELPTFRSMLVSAAGSQSGGIDMSCVECWRECRSIIADAQGVSSLYSKLQLLLMFARQAYSMYISQDPADYIKQTTRLALTNTLQKLTTIRNVREMDEEHATQVANSLLSSIKSLQLEAYGYIQSRLLPILASSPNYFEIASSLYSATSAAIMSYLELHARLKRVNWSSVLAPTIIDDQRYIKYSTKQSRSLPSATTMTVIIARFRYSETVQPEMSQQLLQLEEMRYHLDGEDSADNDAEPISYSLLESPSPAISAQLIMELSLIARHVLNLQRRDQRQFCSLMGYYPKLLTALASTITSSGPPCFDRAENTLAIMEPQLTYISLVAKSLHSTYSSPSALEVAAAGASTNPASPSRGRDLTFAISMHPFMNKLRQVANTYADGERVLPKSVADMQHYRRMLTPRLDGPLPLSFIELLRPQPAIQPSLPVMDAPLALLMRAMPTGVLVECLLLLLSGRSLIITSVSHSLVTFAIEMLPKLCWPVVPRQHRSVVLSTENLSSLLTDTAAQTDDALHVLKSMTDPSHSIQDIAANLGGGVLDATSPPAAATSPDSSLPTPSATTPREAAKSRDSADAQSSSSSHSSGNGSKHKPFAKYLVGMHSATWKAVEVLKPRRWPRPQHQQPPSVVEVLLSETFVLNLDLGTIESPVTDDGLGFAGTDIPEFNDLCAGLVDLLQLEIPMTMQQYNQHIQERCFDFIAAVVLKPATPYLHMYPQHGVVVFDERSFLASLSERQRHFYHQVSRSVGFAAFLSAQANVLHTEELHPQDVYCEAEIHLLAQKYS